MELVVPRLYELCEEIWESLLCLPIEFVDDAEGASPDGDLVRAEIHFDGTWSATVRMTCSSELGKTLAASMFDLARNEIDDEMVDDGFGELANILGGNLKRMVPAGSLLSLPAVTRVAGSAGTSQAEALHCPALVIQSDGHHMWIEVLKPEGAVVDS